MQFDCEPRALNTENTSKKYQHCLIPLGIFINHLIIVHQPSFYLYMNI